jgi:hypothetical protein
MNTAQKRCVQALNARLAIKQESPLAEIIKDLEEVIDQSVSVGDFRVDVTWDPALTEIQKNIIFSHFGGDEQGYTVRQLQKGFSISWDVRLPEDANA